ncbi:MlaD family protein [Antrihabitans stalactiti]|uniref:MCE family protein n=1 Tax=Antrihabitans stalactiti TaxID=2584121 RepID=A0A848KLN1_9NOCA|nr:MlaD family protein [Antrihabitans stalactiti]NMN96687.1 MCE family protein [Antrihabitans stalactiti]
MNINRTALSVAGMVTIAAASFAYMTQIGLEIGALEDTRTATMSIPDTNGLLVGSRVLLRGIAIGHVTAIAPKVDHIDVDWDYDTNYDIPVDSHYRVDNLSALGETYLAVSPATSQGPYLADGASIDTANIVVPTTFKELSERLTRMLEQVDPHRVSDIFHELDVALPDGPDVLSNLSRAGDLLAAAVVDNTTELTKILSTVQPLLLDSDWLSTDLAGATPNMAPMGTNITKMLDGMAWTVKNGPLRDGIRYGVGPFIGELQKFLDNTSADLNTLGVDLLPPVRAGAAAMQTVNVSQLLDNALAATESGDAITIHVQPPGR